MDSCNDLKDLYKEFIGSKEAFKNRLKSLGINSKKIDDCLKSIKANTKAIPVEEKNKIPKEIRNSIEILYKKGYITHNRKQELYKF